MKWYFCWMCLVRAQNCGSRNRIITAWLSQNNSVGIFCECLSSSKKERSQARCCLALLSAMYSDSMVESATMLCCLLDQEIAPQLLMKTKPEVEQELSGSCDHPALEYLWKSMLHAIEAEFHVLCGLNVPEHVLHCLPVTEHGFGAEVAECSNDVGNVWAGPEHEVHQ